MKLSLAFLKARGRKRGWALLVVLSLATCGLMVLAGVMSWANQNSARTARNNEYFATSYAAESAVEKVRAAMTQQYQNYGFSLISANMSTYQATVPTSSDSAYWTNYNFSGGTTANQVIVTNTANSQQIVLSGANQGLTLMANVYEIIANARSASSQYQIQSTVGEQLYLGTVPMFQFAIFYQNDMEIAPGAGMTITGPVHGNANIYLDPQAGLTFNSPVGGSGSNYLHQSPNDPSSRTFSWVDFNSYDLSGVDPLNLPVGTNTASTNSSGQNVYAILEPPASGQTPNSATGTNLLYNHADLIILISNNNTISVTSGAGVNNQATVITNWQSFISTNGSFYDQRDNLTVNPVVINVSNLVTWSATNATLSSALAGVRGTAADNVQSIYVADLRSTSNSTVTTNYSTNSFTSSSPPSPGTYTGSITTNTVVTTNSTYPTAGTYTGSVTTDTTSTNSGSVPSPGTYQGSVTTNAVATTTTSSPAGGTYEGSITNTSTPTNGTSFPAAGTYTGSVTSNKVHGVWTYSYNLKTYSYALISGYTYNQITGYSYNFITGYSYVYVTGAAITNWTINSQPGIVLSNGSILPPQGLSIATPDPAYIVGNWNVQTNTGGPNDLNQNSTAYTYPSAIYADAITVLSPSWNSANSAASLSSRVASSDTVNAAFLTGNVPSNGSYYSGGVENFPRFLEDWGGKTFTYNGSMVCMFQSQIATAHWPGTGGVYNPPTRDWAFDNNFSNPSKEPPMTPQVLYAKPMQWVLLKPGATSF